MSAVPKLTLEQAVIVSAYTGYLASPFSAMHKACEERLGRPIWTHQFPDLREEIREAFKDDFVSICQGIGV